MPIEYIQLKDKLSPISICPKCGANPLIPFLRGTVQSSWRKSLNMPYCCLICEACHEIVDYERP